MFMNFKETAKINQIFQDQITSIGAVEKYPVILKKAKAGKKIFIKQKTKR